LSPTGSASPQRGMAAHARRVYALCMPTERARNRCRERLSRLVDSSLGSEELRHEAAAELDRAIGFDLWCWALADPRSLLACSGVASQVPPEQVARVLPRLLALEQQEPDSARHVIARSRRPVCTLAAATGGEIERSRRWAECIRPTGLHDLAVLSCSETNGCWGWLEAYRAGDARRFEPEETSLLESVASLLGGALRSRAGGAGPLVQHRPAGVLILDSDLRPTSWTGAGRRLIERLPGRIPGSLNLLPSVIYAVAGRAMAPAGTPGEQMGTAARVRTLDGSWFVIDGEALEGAETGHVAITIRAATPDEALELLGRLHTLTPREREVAELLLRGLFTTSIAQRLIISEHTAKDHTKSILAKTGARSRRELVARIQGADPHTDRPPDSATAAVA
jgi:DNA-binding CsgD family transcriptional regulator